MREFIDVTGKTEDEAIAKALEQLGLERDDVSVEILERAKSGFLGLGSCPAKVRVTYGPEEEEEISAPSVEEPKAEAPKAPEKKPERRPEKKEKPARKQESAPKPEPEKKASRPKKAQSKAGRIFQIILTVILVPVCTFASVRLLGWMLETVGRPKAAVVVKTKDMAMLDDFDAYVEKSMAQADSGLKVSHLGLTEQTQPTEEETEPVREHYTIPEDALVAPKPNPSCYGQVDSPAEMEPILKKAKWILDGQKTYFQTNQQIYEDSFIRYYLDDSIFAVTWQEVHDDSVYTFSEIKVEDASQFRRHLADGQYGSDTQYLTTEMAETLWWPPPVISTVSGTSARWSIRGRPNGWRAPMPRPATSTAAAICTSPVAARC